LEINSSGFRETYIRFRGGVSEGGVHRQAQQFYQRLPVLLASVDVRMADIISERIFFRNLTADLHAVREVRSRAYQDSGVDATSAAIISYLGQPPCSPRQALEWQLYTANSVDNTARLVTHFSPRGVPVAKIVDSGGTRHLYASQITGQGSTFRSQCDSMFACAADLLREHGVTFRQVVRTWCYLSDIRKTYAEFNQSRNQFFERAGVNQPPASTGIGAELSLPGSACALDLYALLEPGCALKQPMHTAVLNEATEYGSAFSRGMQVSLHDKTLLYISGTASVDETGATAHRDDFAKQVERMLLNVQQLLGTLNASFSDIVHAISYLKSCRYAPAFHALLAQLELGSLPMSIVEAEVCREQLLCEMEAIAILPKPRAHRS
jgi:enamine deaminase RidA (YjgF/YER057c/UK114 family)